MSYKENQPVSFYPERPGVNLKPIIEVFSKPPEITLTPEERPINAKILGHV